VLGLGTSGSGDVLAGAAGGLAARCGDATAAACWAGLAHRAAGRALAARIAASGYLASELADQLAPTMRQLSSA
jgi:NAD(P)H-hydrate repair Nnr-like enzyme with NAD(P)H-hydrate dehydratase domain